MRRVTPRRSTVVRRPSVRALVEAMETRTLLSAPNTWVMHGPGGGGANFAASISPHDSQDLWYASDMSGVYHSTDFGANWQMQNFHEITGGTLTRMEFTSDPNLLYTLATNFGFGSFPARSTDGGATWSAVGGYAGGASYAISADPASTDHLIIANDTDLYFSADGGNTFVSKYTAAGLYVAGVFWDGPNIYIGTDQGLLVSADGGGTFAPSSAALPSGQYMMSFAGAKQGATTRFLAVTTGSDPAPGTNPNNMAYGGLFRLDLGGSWEDKSPAVAAVAANEAPKHVGLSRGNTLIAYTGGVDQAGRPQVLKTTDGGDTWADVFFTRPFDGGGIPNKNTYAGYENHTGDFDWSWGGGPWGMAVDPNDPNRVFMVNSGFSDVTSDGGATWHQAYVNPADENPPGQLVPKGLPYRTAGTDDTSVHDIAWLSPTTIMAGFTDTNGWRSTDGGTSWAQPQYNGLVTNTIYKMDLAPDGKLYAAASNVHDMYRSTHLDDGRTNPTWGDGRVIVSTDQGASWSLIHEFGYPVVWEQLDPNNPNRMYAMVVDGITSADTGASGGVWVTNDLNLGAASTWTQLPNPPRTEGHGYIIRVLDDGTLVVTFSGRRAGTPQAFTQSSGVFVSTDGGQTWQDRTLIAPTGAPYGSADMSYYTKDVIIDPTDPTQNTWYATVANGWSGTGNDAGDLYRTADRGQTWTRMNLGATVGRISLSTESVTINPTTGEMYLATDGQGIWYAPDARTATPALSPLPAYPFATVERIFLNPYNPGEVWAANFGGGMIVGTYVPPLPPGPYRIVAAGADGGAAPHVKTFEAGTGTQLASFFAYDNGFVGGVRVATVADVTGDGTADVVTGPGPGHEPLVRVFDGVGGGRVREFFAFAAGFLGGVTVAAGDVTGDGADDIVVGAGPGAGPHVKVFDGATGQAVRSFWAFAPGFDGGVRVAAGDVDGDGRAEVIVGAGSAASHVRVFDGATGVAVASFFAYAGFGGGVFVGAGDVDGDGVAEVVTGTDRGPGHVKAFRIDSFAAPSTVASFFAYAAGGARVGAGDVDGAGADDLLTAAAQGGVDAKVYTAAGATMWRQFVPFAGYRGSVSVAARGL